MSRSLDELRDLYGSQGPSSLFEHLKPHARQAIALEHRPMSDSKVQVGSSRLGGLPDLPRGQDWFLNSSTGAPLNFVVQINLSEVAAVADSPLPARGMLFFFYDAEAFGWGFEPEDRHGQRVFFFDGPMEDLAPTPAPTGIDVYEPRSLTFVATTELPDVTSDLVDPDLDDDGYNTYLDLVEDHELGLDTKLLGHSNNVQEGMELTCELASRGMSAGTSESRRDAGAEVREDARHWRLLLQVDSDDYTGMTWGANEGCLYFWIRDDDLAHGRFERSWQTPQT